MTIQTEELYWVTHPDMPNTIGTARSRVLHLKRNDDKFKFKASYCGMKIVEKYDGYSGRRTCIQCTLIRDKENSCG